MFVAALLLLGTVEASELSFGYVPSPGPGEKPGLLVTAPRAVERLRVDCEVGGKTHTWDERGLAARKEYRYENNIQLPIM